jgi:hypothetical protein
MERTANAPAADPMKRASTPELIEANYRGDSAVGQDLEGWARSESEILGKSYGFQPSVRPRRA